MKIREDAAKMVEELFAVNAEQQTEIDSQADFIAEILAENAALKAALKAALLREKATEGS